MANIIHPNQKAKTFRPNQMIENHGPQFSIVNVSSCIGSFPSRCIEEGGVESPFLREGDPLYGVLLPIGEPPPCVPLLPEYMRFLRGRISSIKLSTDRLPRGLQQ